MPNKCYVLGCKTGYVFQAKDRIAPLSLFKPPKEILFRISNVQMYLRM